MSADLEKKAAEEATAKTAAFGAGVQIALKDMGISPAGIAKLAASRSPVFKDATAENLHERIIDWIDQSTQAPAERA